MPMQYVYRFVARAVGASTAAGILLSAHQALAFTVEQTGLNDTATAAGIRTSVSLPTIVGNLVGAALALIGVIFMVLMIYGGFLWMNARGNDQQVEKAKNLITAAVIGLVIIAGGYAITQFVVNNVLISTGVGGSSSGGSSDDSDEDTSAPRGAGSGSCTVDEDCATTESCVSGRCQTTSAGFAPPPAGGGGTCRPRPTGCMAGETPDPTNDGWCCAS